MFLIVGLGNPGTKYAGTRHNIGFDTITHLSDEYDIKLNKKEHKAVCGAGFINGNKVILAQPQTFMNLSGESVREFVDFYHLDPENELIVISDDIDLEPGNIRVRPKGSAGGHNGLKNIIAHLGTQNFTRIKIGVGARPTEWDLADHVLARFDKDTEEIIRDAIDRAGKAAVTIMEEGPEAAMNKYNQKVKS
ncbi:MAG: aminoacyl-tRNA hydrolase [Lachnospiraceae bacterium]|nr:aminoacyl-tRNA hydrolase [Lachnospiraceae bacterium]